MAMSVLTRPNSVNGVVKSDWVASKNPILYKIMRQDHAYDQVADSGGNARFRINGVDLTAYYQVGNSIFITAATQSNYDGQTSEITASSFSGGHTLITTGLSFSATDTGFLVNVDKRTDWKVFIQLFEGVNNQPVSPVTFAFSPSPSTWIATCNIQAILKDYVKAEWSLPSGNNETEADTNLKFYIKYQEYYDGALIGSQTSDSANPFWVVHAAMQIFYMGLTYSHGGNLQGYLPSNVSSLWLTRFQASTSVVKIRMWRGWPFTLSFIWPDEPEFIKLRRNVVQYSADGVQVASSSTALTQNAGALNRLTLPAIDAAATRVDVHIQMGLGTTSNNLNDADVPNSSFENPWTNIPNGANIDWNFGTPGQAIVSLAVGETSDYARSDAFTNGIIPAGAGVEIAYNVAMSGDIKRLKFYAWNGTTRGLLATVDLIAGFINSSVTAVAPFNFDKLEVEAIATAGAVVVNLNSLTIFHSVLILTSTLSIAVEEPCENPVYLFWKNSAGGDSFYMFDVSQELNYPLRDGKKERALLSKTSLFPVEWEALQELISPKEVYKNNIIELNSTVIKTHSRIGHQVYQIDQSGNKIGVVTFDPGSSRITKQIKSTFNVEIEYPEVYE